MKKTIGAVVPSLRRLGGVRHFLEVGNVLVDRGYKYTVFSDAVEEKNLTWFDYKGICARWEYGISSDILLIGDPQLLPAVKQMKGKIYVWVMASGPYKKLYDAYYGKFPFIVNNRWFLKDYPEAKLCEGGVNINHFRPKKRRVLFYSGGARGLQKQGHVIYEQLGDLSDIELVELQNLDNNQLVDAYHRGDYFVSWEVEGGFSNTSAEALACGLPVVTNGHNCEPFLDKVIIVKNLREFFTEPMKKNSWEKTVDDLLKIIK